MRCDWLPILLAACLMAAIGAATAQAALTPADVYAYYPFDDTSGTVFSDASLNNADATLYRPMRLPELPTVDVANVTSATGQYASALGIGNRTVGGTGTEILVKAPAISDLPGTGDSFAVSYWLNVTNWTNCYGQIAAFNGNGLNWNIGMHNASSAKGLVAWTSDANVGTGGNAQWTANLSAAGLVAGTYNHFVVQFQGDLGVTACYVNGVSVTDAVDESIFWGNRKEGLLLGGRALDVRGFTVPNYTPFLDDFAVIDGVVSSADVINLRDSGAASLGARRLAHYALDDATGSTIVDSSAYANHGTLVGYQSATMGLATRDVSTASEPGVFGKAAKFGEAWPEHARMASVSQMPTNGEEFTVCFWYKPDEQLAVTHKYGWDWKGELISWSANGIGFALGTYDNGTGNIVVATTDGTQSGNRSVYDIDVGTGSALNLPPDQFAHFAVTVNAARQITGVYVNGDYVAKTAGTSYYYVTDANTGILGARVTGGTPGNGNSGFLDDFAVLKGQLTEAQIEQIMTLGVAGSVVPEPSAMILLLGVLFTACLARRVRS